MSDISNLPNGDIEVQRVGPSQPAPQPIAQTVSSEPKYRINIKQSAKEKAYWELTVRGDNIGDVQKDVDALCDVAIMKCQELNLAKEIPAPETE